MANFLGIDYGEKYVGLALASSPLAEPLETVSTFKAIPIISSLITQHHIDKIIIGLSENQMAVKTKAFGSQLHELTGLPVIYHDETLSSFETRKRMAQAGKKKSAREQKIDHYVAATILEDYLDSLK